MRKVGPGEQGKKAPDGARRNGAPAGRAAPFGLFERSVAMRYLMAKRAHGGVALISVISFTGIMLAVAVLTISMSVFNGFRHELLGRLLGAQGHIFVTAAEQSLVEDLAADLAQAPDVLRAAPVISGQSAVMADRLGVVQIYGVDKEDLETLTILTENLSPGALERFGEAERSEILIGRQLAERLDLEVGDPVKLLSPNCSGGTITGQCLRQIQFHVGGVFEVGMSLIDELFVYMPRDRARRLLDRDPSHAADFIEVTVADPDDIPGALRTLGPIVGDRGTMADWRFTYEGYAQALDLQRNVVRLILSLLVVIAALNIISGLVMLAKNKSGDIAILRTMGSSQGSIMRIFVLVGATVGVLGTIAGLALGVLFCANIGAIQGALEWLLRTELFPQDIYYLAQIPARVEVSEVVIVGLLSFVASCAATLLPAWNAARLDPVEALRYG